MSFIEELKRRNVVRVGIAYVIAAWLLLQLTEVLMELLDLPEFAGRLVILLLIVGFIPALIFAWAFEMTPDGIKREKDVDRSNSITPRTGRKLDNTIIAILVIALAYFVFDKFQGPSVEPATATLEATQQPGDTAAEEASLVDPSIAVLPFADMSPEQDQGYFSDGISEELLNLLVRVDGLKVASRTSSFTYKGSSQSLAEIAGELKVDHVLEGSVRKADNRVRITAQLIDAKTDRHLWSETFDRDLVDIFAVQDEIANAIVEALRTELGMLQDTPVISVAVDTENLDAYESYLKARSLFLAREQLEESVRLYQQAVALDPGFARAWGGLASVYAIVESWGITGHDWDALAIQAAETALELDPKLSTPWAVIGQIKNNQGDYISGMKNFDRAVELDPVNATNYLWRGIHYSTLGYHDKATIDLETCLEIDPAYENCRRHLALTHEIVNNDELALKLFQQGTERGFKGSSFMFVSRLVSGGERLLAATIIFDSTSLDSSFPAGAVLDAIEFPDRDHSRGMAKFQNWVEKSGYEISSYPIILIAFKAYHLVEPAPFQNRWVWLRENKAFRTTRYFRPFLDKLGILAYWRENGFPPGCRPLGEEDFECD